MASAASCRAAESWPQARRRCRSRGGWAVGRSAGHDVRAVGEYRRDEPEHVAVGVEQVAHAADALHVRQWERLGAAEIEALLEQLIDTAVDADDDVAPVHRSPALWGRALALGEPAVDAVAGCVRAHGTLTGVDGPVRHVAELGELPTEQFAVEVNEPLRLGRMYLEVHDEVRHDVSFGLSSSRYAHDTNVPSGGGALGLPCVSLEVRRPTSVFLDGGAEPPGQNVAGPPAMRELVAL